MQGFMMSTKYRGMSRGQVSFVIHTACWRTVGGGMRVASFLWMKQYFVATISTN